MKNELLEQLRTAAGLSQEELAQALKLPRNSIAVYESGDREPRDEVKVKIAQYLDVSVQDLFPDAVEAVHIQSNKSQTMLKPDSTKFLIAMAEAELEPAELAEKAGISKNIVYSMRRGFYTKPKYLGMVARALDKKVVDLI